jgi:ABC-type amino acid transport substrate-binding protein
MQFEQLMPALRGDKVDAVMTNMTINPGRNLDLSFATWFLAMTNNRSLPEFYTS